MTATSSEPAIRWNAGPLLRSVTAPTPTIPHRTRSNVLVIRRGYRRPGPAVAGGTGAGDQASRRGFQVPRATAGTKSSSATGHVTVRPVSADW